MGYDKRAGSFGHSISTFWPDDNENEFYIASYGETPLTDILAQAREHFGDRFDLTRISIQAEYIHTDCLGYDSYDAGDYTNFLHISLEP